MDSKIDQIIYDLSLLKIDDQLQEVEEIEDDEEERELKIVLLISKFKLGPCVERLRKRVCRTDCDGFIYAYSSVKHVGMFKVGMSKHLPNRRVKMQEKKNHETYVLKKSYFCCFHKLVEKCVHLELGEWHKPLNKVQDGYTEWFMVDWEFLDIKIKNVIKCVQELLTCDLLYLPRS